MQVFAHRMNLTAHISLQILAISKSEIQNQPEAPSSSWRNPRHLPQIFCLANSNLAIFVLLCNPDVRLSAAGEGAFTDGVRNPQGVFSAKVLFF